VREDRIPVANSVDLKAISPHPTAILGEKIDNEPRWADVMPGVVRTFDSFSAALDEMNNARIYAGIHFRSATNDGQTLGVAVAEYVLQNAVQPVHGSH
jgi:hypothetical protein